MKTLELLTGIWGVGPKLADSLYNKGIRTIEDLRNQPDLLTQYQSIGLKYYEDFLPRMPRDEATMIGVWVEDTAK